MLCNMTKECNLAQVREMERFSGIVLSAEQIILYIFIRDNMQETVIDSDPQNPLNTLRPSTMSDQVLLAEIIKATDDNCLKKFTDSYPNIFLD